MTFMVFAQKSDDLKEKRDLIKQKIEKTSSEIQSTTKKRKTTYQQFLDLKKNISSKQEMVKELEGEIEQIDERIRRQEDVVNSLAADMGLMKARYSVLLRKAYRAQQSNHQFLFIYLIV